MNFIEFGKFFVPLLVLISHAIFGLVVTLLVMKRTPFWKLTHSLAEDILPFVKKHAMLLAWIVSLAALLGSLFYSELARYEPCKLCWYQRILMYPLVLMIGIALWKKTTDVVKYVKPLAGIGVAVAGFHYITQLFKLPLSCSAHETAVDCSVKYIAYHGYITIPFMAFTAFGIILFLMYFGFWKEQE